MSRNIYNTHSKHIDIYRLGVDNVHNIYKPKVYVFLEENYYYRRTRWRLKDGSLKICVYIYRYGDPDAIGVIHIVIPGNNAGGEDDQGFNNNNNNINNERINKRTMGV